MPEPTVQPVAPVAQPVAPAQEPGAQVVTPAPVELPANWYDSETYKEHVPGNEGHFQKYKTESEFVKAGIEAMKDRTSTAIPKSDDPKYTEKMTSLYDAMGRNSKAEEYNIEMLEVPAELQNQISFSEDFMGKAKEIAAKHRVSQELFNELTELQQTMVLDVEQAKFDARTAKAEECETELKKDPAFATNSELVKRLLTSEGAQGLADELAETGYGNSPVLFKVLAAYAKEEIGEGTIDPAAPGSAPSTTQPNSEAANRKAEYEQDKARWPHSAPASWRHSAEFHKA